MPLILLGLLVVAGLLAYLYFTRQSETSAPKTTKKHSSKKKEDAASVIYLPDDIEGEKRKRHVKTGK